MVWRRQVATLPIILLPDQAGKNSLENQDTFDRLMAQVMQRAAAMPEGSYTTKLIRGGVEKMGAKILEEAQEVVDAARESETPDNDHLIYEAGDLIYHLWVLLGSRGIHVDQIRNELARREGVSGLEEKKNRTAKD